MHFNQEEQERKSSLMYTLELLVVKLKHLQLCKIDYDKNFNEAREYFKNNHVVNQTPKLEYYSLQAQRYIIEILSIFHSLRDLLKERLYKHGNGNLQPFFGEISKEHKELIRQTFGSKTAQQLKNFAFNLRNEFIHNNLHTIRFVSIYDNPDDPVYEKTILTMKIKGKDYESGLLRTAQGILKTYIFDAQIETLRLNKSIYGFVDSFMEPLKIRANLVPSAKQDYLIFEEKMKQVEKKHGAQLEKIKQKHNIIANLFKRLVDNPDFVNYYLNLLDFISESPAPCKIGTDEIKKIEKHIPNCFLNFGEVFEDMYQLFYSYYTQLHALLFCDNPFPEEELEGDELEKEEFKNNYKNFLDSLRYEIFYLLD